MYYDFLIIYNNYLKNILKLFIRGNYWNIFPIPLTPTSVIEEFLNLKI